MQDSIFTKIIKGEIPCHRVYEDDKTIAFLDIYPVQEGMTLVVTKNQVDNFEDLSEDDYTALWATVKKVAQKMRRVYPDKAKIAVQVEGLDVPHVHVKLFAINSGDEFRTKQDTSKDPDHASLAAVAAKLAI